MQMEGFHPPEDTTFDTTGRGAGKCYAAVGWNMWKVICPVVDGVRWGKNVRVHDVWEKTLLKARRNAHL